VFDAFDGEVVVDSFAESRQHDVLHLAEELEHEDINEKRPAWQLWSRRVDALQHLVPEVFYPKIDIGSL